jgi:5-methylcytosine-specific restriction endonuclease McrA
MSKEIIPRRLRNIIIERDGQRCVYCGVDLELNEIHIDHVIPESKGGPTNIQNLQVTCRKCNTEKGALSESAFEDKLRTRALNILNRIGHQKAS